MVRMFALATASDEARKQMVGGIWGARVPQGAAAAPGARGSTIRKSRHESVRWGACRKRISGERAFRVRTCHRYCRP